MNLDFANGPLASTVDHKKELAAIKRTIAREPKDRETALKWLVGTGMHTKTGKLKKQFR